MWILRESWQGENSLTYSLEGIGVNDVTSGNMVSFGSSSSGDTASITANPTGSGLLVIAEENQSSAGSGGSGARELIPTTTGSLESSTTLSDSTCKCYNFCNN